MEDLASKPRITQAQCVAKRLNVTVALKGVHTVVAAPDGRVSVNSSGSSALATGGSGDVLAGMIGTFLHQLDDPFDATRVAVFIHGYAAEDVPCKRALLPDDILDRLGHAMARISPHA
jgi:NAD(P)H-hydrate repair Nnr-like enzyme with NAD(P)H-hydrate dehydratase domain